VLVPETILIKNQNARMTVVGHMERLEVVAILGEYDAPLYSRMSENIRIRTRAKAGFIGSENIVTNCAQGSDKLIMLRIGVNQ
jgi:hypothetical protein